MKSFSAILLAGLLCGCSHTLDKMAFRDEVPQGNVVSQAQIDQLKPGMSKQQVAQTLGTPLLLDPFHANRWDYVHRMTSSKGIVTQNHIALYFSNNDTLEKITGQMVPSEASSS